MLCHVIARRGMVRYGKVLHRINYFALAYRRATMGIRQYGAMMPSEKKTEVRTAAYFELHSSAWFVFGETQRKVRDAKVLTLG